jgi:thymidylate kinase
MQKYAPETNKPDAAFMLRIAIRSAMARALRAELSKRYPGASSL